MTKQLIKGIHHVTATVDGAQEDFDFYTKLLGQRLVKQTVNFDNNRVYHFYYGDEKGAPGTVMTTFPYRGQGVRRGSIGAGQVSVTGFSAPATAIDFWTARLAKAGVAAQRQERFGLPVLTFHDPAGLQLEITGNDEDGRRPWSGGEVGADQAIRGFYTVVLLVAEVGPTHDFLTSEFGFSEVAREGDTVRYAVAGGGPGRYVDVRRDPEAERGHNGIGTVHHVAWRVEDDEALLAMRRRLANELAFRVTEVKDRKYFHSIYFRMPGHVLFEIATIPPGFTLDESPQELGRSLKLPAWEEPHRQQIERELPKISKS